MSTGNETMLGLANYSDAKCGKVMCTKPPCHHLAMCMFKWAQKPVLDGGRTANS